MKPDGKRFRPAIAELILAADIGPCGTQIKRAFVTDAECVLIAIVFTFDQARPFVIAPVNMSRVYGAYVFIINDQCGMRRRRSQQIVPCGGSAIIARAIPETCAAV